MKKFIIKTIIFILILPSYFGANMIINYYIYSSQSLPIEKMTILIVGDSHPQTSLNPNLFKSAVNISKSAEPYILTYWKLRKILTLYKPDTILLGFAPHNISQFNDRKFSDKHWSLEMFSRSYPIEHFDEIEDIIPIDYLNYYKTLWKETGFYPKRNHWKYIGKFLKNHSSNISDYETSINRHYFFNGNKLGVSNISINYLDSIVDLCSNNNITLVLVSNPVHKNYFDNIPKTILSTYEKLKTKYRRKAIIIDRTNNFYPDSLYSNSDHLNELGAKIFSNEVKLFMEQNNVRTHNKKYSAFGR